MSEICRVCALDLHRALSSMDVCTRLGRRVRNWERKVVLRHITVMSKAKVNAVMRNMLTHGHSKEREELPSGDEEADAQSEDESEDESDEESDEESDDESDEESGEERGEKSGNDNGQQSRAVENVRDEPTAPVGSENVAEKRTGVQKQLTFAASKAPAPPTASFLVSLPPGAVSVVKQLSFHPKCINPVVTHGSAKERIAIPCDAIVGLCEREKCIRPLIVGDVEKAIAILKRLNTNAAPVATGKKKVGTSPLHQIITESNMYYANRELPPAVLAKKVHDMKRESYNPLVDAALAMDHLKVDFESRTKIRSIVPVRLGYLPPDDSTLAPVVWLLPIMSEASANAVISSGCDPADIDYVQIGKGATLAFYNAIGAEWKEGVHPGVHITCLPDDGYVELLLGAAKPTACLAIDPKETGPKLDAKKLLAHHCASAQNGKVTSTLLKKDKKRSASTSTAHAFKATDNRPPVPPPTATNTTVAPVSRKKTITMLEVVGGEAIAPVPVAPAPVVRPDTTSGPLKEAMEVDERSPPDAPPPEASPPEASPPEAQPPEAQPPSTPVHAPRPLAVAPNAPNAPRKKAKLGDGNSRTLTLPPAATDAAPAQATDSDASTPTVGSRPTASTIAYGPYAHTQESLDAMLFHLGKVKDATDRARIVKECNVVGITSVRMFRTAMQMYNDRDVAADVRTQFVKSILPTTLYILNTIYKNLDDVVL